MPDARPDIPEPVKRSVRQRCGFGCVICGLPIYDYDHITPWSEVHEHDAANIVLLCVQHHREKTSGLLPGQGVIEASTHPFNLQSGQSHPYDLHYAGSGCTAIIGSNVYGWPNLTPGTFTIPLLVDDTPLVFFRAEDEHLLLTVQLFDQTNQLLVQILDNQLVYSAASWDVEFVGRQLTVRGGPGDIFVRMTFDTPAAIVIDRGHVWRNGIELDIAPDRLLLVNNQFNITGSSATNCVIGIGVGDCPQGLGAAMMMGSMRNTFQNDPVVEQRVLRLVNNAYN